MSYFEVNNNRLKVYQSTGLSCLDNQPKLPQGESWLLHQSILKSFWVGPDPTETGNDLVAFPGGVIETTFSPEFTDATL
ncbi:MAG: hypothetical protein DMF71_11825 [Acidobacteria bacterium]|nr:MAG: hypothetical protein DMF71_11825 [Acidobacteriota bacterium]